jgi:hypothetical protein
MKHAFLLTAALVAISGSAEGEEYGVVLTLNGDAPVAVPFFKCDPNKRDIPSETAPPVCRTRGSRDPEDSFYVETARITNLGDTLVWVYVGEDKLPVLPKSIYNLIGQSKARFRRIFLSASPEETARVHVFASDPIRHDRFLLAEDDRKR